MSKVVLITGASSGLGKEFAKALLKEGLVVYTVARRIKRMNDLKELGAITLQMDISKDEDIQAVVNQIKIDHGVIDILINNAGFGFYGAMEDISIDDARYQFEVNLFGLARLTQLLLPMMREKKSGRIINISSIAGKVYSPFGSWYHASKHALEGWSDCLRIELATFGIDVVIIEPGVIQTEFGEVVAGQMMEYSAQGAYADLAHKMEKALEQEYARDVGSNPQVITDLVLKAIRAKKPKTRYIAGKYSTFLLFLRKWFGDRIYDRLVMSLLK